MLDLSCCCYWLVAWTGEPGSETIWVSWARQSSSWIDRSIARGGSWVSCIDRRGSWARRWCPAAGGMELLRLPALLECSRRPAGDLECSRRPAGDLECSRRPGDAGRNPRPGDATHDPWIAAWSVPPIRDLEWAGDGPDLERNDRWLASDRGRAR